MTAECPLRVTRIGVNPLDRAATSGLARALEGAGAGTDPATFQETTMPSIRRLLMIPAVAVIAACGGNDRDVQPLDAGLRNDLALAASSQQMPPLQYMSPMEQGYGQPVGYGNQAYGYP